MSGDALREILDAARLAQPDVPAEVWTQMEATIRRHFGATRVYIAAHRKRQNLNAVEASPQGESATAMARRLGVTERRLRQYKQLLGGR